MSFFKYPFFMSMKKRGEILDNLIEYTEREKRNCPFCKYRYRKGEDGNSYSLAKISHPKFYPDDYVDGVCPLCKLEKEDDDFSLELDKDNFELIRRLILWREKRKKK